MTEQIMLRLTMKVIRNKDEINKAEQTQFPLQQELLK